MERTDIMADRELRGKYVKETLQAIKRDLGFRPREKFEGYIARATWNAYYKIVSRQERMKKKMELI